MCILQKYIHSKFTVANLLGEIIGFFVKLYNNNSSPETIPYLPFRLLCTHWNPANTIHTSIQRARYTHAHTSDNSCRSTLSCFLWLNNTSRALLSNAPAANQCHFQLAVRNHFNQHCSLAVSVTMLTKDISKL